MLLKDLRQLLNYYAAHKPEVLDQPVRLELEEGEFYDIETLYEVEPGLVVLTMELTREVEARLRNR